MSPKVFKAFKIGLLTAFTLCFTFFAISDIATFSKPKVAQAAYPLGDEVIFYNFEQTTGTSTNLGSGGSAYDGTYVGNASSTNLVAKFGSRSGSFGETGDYLRTYYASGTNPTTQSISVSMWVYKKEASAGCGSGDDDHFFGVSGPQANTRFYLRCTTNVWGTRFGAAAAANSTTTVLHQQWQHVALVFNAATDTPMLYVNNARVTTSATVASFVLGDNLFVGNFNDRINNTFNEGSNMNIDDVAIYNRALSEADITTLYQAGLTPDQPVVTATGYEGRTLLTWPTITGGTTDYLIEYKLSSEPTTWTTFADGVSTATSTMVTGLTNGSSYDFRVSAVSPSATGTPSATVSATPAYRVSFLSPTPAQSSTVNSSSITVWASSSLPTASFASSTQIIRLETAAGVLVAQIATTTRYGNYNVLNHTNITSGLAMSGVPVQSSGAGYVPTTQTIFIPHNTTTGLDTTISEIDTNGTKISRTITCLACGDIESMVLLSSVASSTAPGTFMHEFLVGTENTTGGGSFYRLQIPSTGTVSISPLNTYTTSITHASNGGFEGIAYNATTGYVYLATEISTKRLFEYSTTTGAQSEICTNLSWDASITDFTDLYLKDNILYVLSENTNPTKLVAVDITSTSTCAFVDSDGDSNTSGDTGDYLSSIAVGATDQGEGFTWDSTGDFLYFIGEANFFGKYRTNVFSSRYTFSGLADGNYVLKSAFVDANGVTSSSTDRAFTINTDATAPTITNITSDTANGTYKVGDVIDIDVTFSENVTSTGNVTITLETGSIDRTCTFTVSNSNTGTCNYTVQSGDSSSDLQVSSVSGTIADAGSNAMTNFVPATNLASNKALVIDGAVPQITGGSITTTETGATINWTTNINASSSVAYGATVSYGTVSTSTGHTTHSVTLTGLSAGTTYHYQIFASSFGGNTSTTADGTFTTASPSSGGSQSSTANSSTPIPGSQTAVSGSSYTSAQLQAIFGSYYTPPAPLAPQNPSTTQLISSVPALSGIQVNISPIHIISSGLVIKNIASQGINNLEIRTIQKLLNSFKETTISSTGAGSAGKETTLYGPATKRAVEKFQLLFKIVSSPNDPGYGRVGPKTKAKMNELLKK